MAEEADQVEAEPQGVVRVCAAREENAAMCYYVLGTMDPKKGWVKGKAGFQFVDQYLCGAPSCRKKGGHGVKSRAKVAGAPAAVRAAPAARPKTATGKQTASSGGAMASAKAPVPAAGKGAGSKAASEAQAAAKTAAAEVAAAAAAAAAKAAAAAAAAANVPYQGTDTRQPPGWKDPTAAAAAANEAAVAAASWHADGELQLMWLHEIVGHRLRDPAKPDGNPEYFVRGEFNYALEVKELKRDGTRTYHEEKFEATLWIDEEMFLNYYVLDEQIELENGGTDEEDAERVYGGELETYLEAFVAAVRAGERRRNAKTQALRADRPPLPTGEQIAASEAASAAMAAAAAAADAAAAASGAARRAASGVASSGAASDAARGAASEVAARKAVSGAASEVAAGASSGLAALAAAASDTAEASTVDSGAAHRAASGAASSGAVSGAACGAASSARQSPRRTLRAASGEPSGSASGAASSAEPSSGSKRKRAEGTAEGAARSMQHAQVSGEPAAGKRGQYIVRVLHDHFNNDNAERRWTYHYRVVWDTGDESTERDECMLDRELIEDYWA